MSASFPIAIRTVTTFGLAGHRGASYENIERTECKDPEYLDGRVKGWKCERSLGSGVEGPPDCAKRAVMWLSGERA